MTGTPAKLRMYVDEVGNNDLGSSDNPNHRFLSLTGVILDLSYVQNTLHPNMENLKNTFFNGHPDDPVVFHRKELLNKRHPFQALRNRATEEEFNHLLLGYLESWEYRVISVVIDKKQHKEHYGTWRYDPYHYCQEILLERFALYLKRSGCVGDIMAESRGGKEDRRLKTAFNRLYNQGTGYVNKELFSKVLTSCQLKVKRKGDNIAGLQLADLIAHPAWRAAQNRRDDKELPDTFGARIAKILEEKKYLRSPSGEIKGWGRKWLPE